MLCTFVLYRTTLCFVFKWYKCTIVRKKHGIYPRLSLLVVVANTTAAVLVICYVVFPGLVMSRRSGPGRIDRKIVVGHAGPSILKM